MTVKIDLQRELKRVQRRVERGMAPCTVCRSGLYSGCLLGMVAGDALKSYRVTPTKKHR